MKKRFIKENSNSDRFYLTVNLDERGDYSATLYDYDDNEVWDCDYELVSELIDDGYLKYKPDEDLDRLAEYLGSVGVIPRGSTIDSEKEESMEESRRMYSRKSGRTKLLESKLRKVIRPMVERMLREASGIDDFVNKYKDTDPFDFSDMIERKKEERDYYAGKGDQNAVNTTDEMIEKHFYNRTIQDLKKIWNDVESFISNKDVSGLKKRLSYFNKMSLDAFRMQTGVDLGKTNRDIANNIDKYFSTRN